MQFWFLCYRTPVFAEELKRDGALNTLLRERGREMGVVKGSRLERVVQSSEIDARLLLSLGIEHGPPRQRSGPSPSMGM